MICEMEIRNSNKQTNKKKKIMFLTTDLKKKKKKVDAMDTLDN